MGTETPLLRTLPDLALYTSSSGCKFVFFIINWSMEINTSLSSVSHSSKVIELEEGVVRTSHL